MAREKKKSCRKSAALFSDKYNSTAKTCQRIIQMKPDIVENFTVSALSGG